MFIMRDSNKQDFLFKCITCETILSVALSNEDDIEDVMNDKLSMDCPCGSFCKVLYN